MSRKNNEPSDSLDMLLDTICNTFGGVLFISLLVVVLLTMTSEKVRLEPPSDEAQRNLVEKRTKLEETEFELSLVKANVEQQSRYAEANLDPETEKLVEQIEKTGSRYEDLEETKGNHLGQVSNDQIEVNDIAKMLAQLKQEKGQAEMMLALAQQRLREEIEARKISRMPTSQKTKLEEVPFFLRKGRLHCHVKCGPDGSLAPNTEECMIVTGSDGRKSIEPRPGVGTWVDLGGGPNLAVEDRLDDFDRDEHYFKLFVWPDSFEHFLVVQSLVVHHKFLYRLIPISDDDAIYFQSSAGDVTVQN